MAADRTIKVCFVCPKCYPLLNQGVEAVFGGAEVDAYQIGRQLGKEDGFEVSYIVADYGQEDFEDRDGIGIYKSLNFEQNSLLGAYKIWRALRRSDADVFVLKTLSPGIPLVRLFSRLGKRVFCYRTASMKESDGRYLKEHPFKGRLFIGCLRKADAVFVQNRRDAENMKRTTGIEPMIIANGHHLPDVAIEAKDSVLWVGRSEPVKRPGKFLELARRVPGENFVMICQRATGDDRYDELRREAGAISNLEFIERVPFDRVEEYFLRAKVLVNTSDSEGFPNTFIQACKCSAAILSLNVDPDDFLEKHGCGVFCGGSEERMAEELGRLVADDAYVEYGRRGREYVAEHHDIAKIVEVYKDVFGRLVRG